MPIFGIVAAIISCMFLTFVISEFTPVYYFKIIVLPAISIGMYIVDFERHSTKIAFLLFFWVLLMPSFKINAKTKVNTKLPSSFYVIWFVLTAIVAFLFTWLSRPIDTSIENVLSNSLGLFIICLYPSRLLLPYILAPWKFSDGTPCTGKLLQVIPVPNGHRIRRQALRFEGDKTTYSVSYNLGQWYRRNIGHTYTYKRYLGAYGMVYIKSLWKVSKDKPNTTF